MQQLEVKKTSSLEEAFGDWEVGTTADAVPQKRAFEDLSEEEKRDVGPSKACIMGDPDCEACQ